MAICFGTGGGGGKGIDGGTTESSCEVTPSALGKGGGGGGGSTVKASSVSDAEDEAAVPDAADEILGPAYLRIRFQTNA